MKPVTCGFPLVFEHVEIISMVDKSTDHGQLVSICCIEIASYHYHDYKNHYYCYQYSAGKGLLVNSACHVLLFLLTLFSTCVYLQIGNSVNELYCNLHLHIGFHQWFINKLRFCLDFFLSKRVKGQISYTF